MNISKIGFSGMLKLTKPVPPKEQGDSPSKEIIFIPERNVKEAKVVYKVVNSDGDNAIDRIEITRTAGYTSINAENIDYVVNGSPRTMFTSLEYLG